MSDPQDKNLEIEDLIQKLADALDGPKDDEKPAVEDPTAPIVKLPAKKEEPLSPLDLMVDSVTSTFLEGNAKAKEYNDWRINLAQQTEAKLKKHKKELEQPWYKIDPGAFKIEEEAKKELKEAPLPPDPLDTVIPAVIKELDASGVTTSFVKNANPQMIKLLKGEISTAIANFWDSGQLHELFSAAEGAGEPGIHDTQARLMAAVATNVILHRAPLSLDEYQKSSELSIKAIARRELAQLKGKLNQTKAMGGDPLKALEKNIAYLEHLSTAGSKECAEIRRRMGNEGLFTNLERMKTDIAEEALRLEVGIKKPQRPQFWYRGIKQPDSVWSEDVDNEFNQNVTWWSVTKDHMKRIFGVNWRDTLSAGYKNIDTLLKLRRMGVINDGIDFESGVLESNPSSPEFLSPIDFLKGKGTPEDIARMRRAYGKFAGKVYSNYDDTLKTLNALEQSRMLSKAQKEQLKLNRVARHVTLLADNIREKAAAATTGEPGAKPMQPYDYPGWDVTLKLLNGLEGFTKDITDG